MISTFDRDRMADSYAKRHRAADPAIREIHYLPTDAPADEIRLVEVNEAIGTIASPEPVDFGVDGGTANHHRLIVLDVTPVQWEEIRAGTLDLPPGWTLRGSQKLPSSRRRQRS